MWVYFTNFDSDGRPVTDRLAVTIDGERHVVEPTDTGAAQVSETVGDHLIDSDAAVVADPPSDSTADE